MQLPINSWTFFTPRRVKENENVFRNIIYNVVKSCADDHLNTQQNYLNVMPSGYDSIRKSLMWTEKPSVVNLI